METELIYDPDKLTILEGFNISVERMNTLIEKYVHGSRGDIISRIVHDELLPPNEKYALLINLGVLLVESVIGEMREGYVSNEMNNKGA